MSAAANTTTPAFHPYTPVERAPSTELELAIEAYLKEVPAKSFMEPPSIRFIDWLVYVIGEHPELGTLQFYCSGNLTSINSRALSLLLPTPDDYLAGPPAVLDRVGCESSCNGGYVATKRELANGITRSASRSYATVAVRGLTQKARQILAAEILKL